MNLDRLTVLYVAIMDSLKQTASQLSDSEHVNNKSYRHGAKDQMRHGARGKRRCILRISLPQQQTKLEVYTSRQNEKNRCRSKNWITISADKIGHSAFFGHNYRLYCYHYILTYKAQTVVYLLSSFYVSDSHVL